MMVGREKRGGIKMWDVEQGWKGKKVSRQDG